MLDPGLLRDQIEVIRTAMTARGVNADAELEQLATLEARRRRLIPELCLLYTSPSPRDS